MTQAATIQQVMVAIEQGKSILVRTEPGLGVLHRIGEALSKKDGVLWACAAVCEDFDWHNLARIALSPTTTAIVAYDLDAIHPSAVDLLKLVSGNKPVIGIGSKDCPAYFFDEQLAWPAPTPEEWMTEMRLTRG